MLTEDQTTTIKTVAAEDAAAFVAEFGEAFDPKSTDWDGTAWAIVCEENNLDLVDDTEAFELYQRILMEETERRVTA